MSSPTPLFLPWFVARFVQCANGAGPFAHAALITDTAYSKISIAAAIVVVHKPRLSPIADCVTFAVRTILLEMR